MLNPVDLVIIVIVGFSGLAGLWRGLVREALSLATWIAALLALWWYGETFAALLAEFIEQPPLRYLIAFLLLFLAVMIVGRLLARLLAGILALAGLNLIDRVLGCAFGVLRGLLIVCALLFGADLLLSEWTVWRDLQESSLLVPYCLALLEAIVELVSRSPDGVVI